MFGFRRLLNIRRFHESLKCFSETGTSRSFCTVLNGTSKVNWDQRLPFILKAIQEADFVTVDVEFTGLHDRSDRFVGVDRCYEAHSQGAKSFMPVQFGICAAKRALDNEKLNQWIFTPFSVYVYPRTDSVFQVSTAALRFLKENNFDFNEWVANGVSCLRVQEEEERKAAVLSRINEIKELKQNSSTKSDFGKSSDMQKSVPIQIPDEGDRSTVTAVRGKIMEWLQQSQSGEVSAPLEIPMENAFQRLLLHTVIAQEFPHVYSYSSRRSEKRILCIYRSQGEVFDEQIRSLENELNAIDSLVGVRKIFDEISSQKKVIVGHNCFYDFLHVYQYCYSDLPSSVTEFKQQWTKLFSHTLDTKYISEAHELISSLQPPATLKGLCDFMVNVTATSHSPASSHYVPLVCSINNIPGSKWRLPLSYQSVLDPESSIEGRVVIHSNDPDATLDNSDLSHDAGFDALLTAVLFLTQCSYIFKQKKVNWNIMDFKCTGSKYGKTVIDHFILMDNRIRLVKTQPNMINLAGSDEVDMTRHLFMTGFPSTWKKWEVMKVWSPVWVNTSWIDDQSCWIIAKSDDDVKNIQMIYSMMKPPLFKLFTFDEYKKLRQLNND